STARSLAPPPAVRHQLEVPAQEEPSSSDKFQNSEIAIPGRDSLPRAVDLKVSLRHHGQGRPWKQRNTLAYDNRAPGRRQIDRLCCRWICECNASALRVRADD